MPPKRRLKKKISIKLKKEIVKKFNGGVKIKALMKEYNLCQSTISTIVKQSEILEKIDVSDNSNTVEKGRELIMKMEKLLLIWLKDNQMDFDGFSMNCICERAKKIFDELKMNSPSTAETRYDDFKASKGWFERFRNRCELEKVLCSKKYGNYDKEAADFFKIIELEKKVVCNETKVENSKAKNEKFSHQPISDDALLKHTNYPEKTFDAYLTRTKSQKLPETAKNQNVDKTQNFNTTHIPSTSCAKDLKKQFSDQSEKSEDDENDVKDSFYYFAMSIAEQLRNMPEETVYHCQVEIQNIIMAKRVAIFNESKNPNNE